MCHSDPSMGANDYVAGKRRATRRSGSTFHATARNLHVAVQLPARHSSGILSRSRWKNIWRLVEAVRQTATLPRVAKSLIKVLEQPRAALGHSSARTRKFALLSPKTAMSRKGPYSRERKPAIDNWKLIAAHWAVIWQVRTKPWRTLQVLRQRWMRWIPQGLRSS